MCFKAGLSRAEAHSLNVNGGKMWCGRWLSSVTCATRRCCSTWRLLHSKISVHRWGQGLHCPASQMPCPTSSPVPDTSQGQERSSPPFSATDRSRGPCCMPGCSPTAAPAWGTARPREPGAEQSSSQHCFCWSGRWSQAQLLTHVLLPGPNPLSISKFICYQLSTFCDRTDTRYICHVLRWVLNGVELL